MSKDSMEETSQKDMQKIVKTALADKTKICWKSNHRKYQTIVHIMDSKGVRVPELVKFSDWKIQLDLTDSKQKQIHEALLKSDWNKVEINILEDVDKNTTMGERALTLKKLNSQSINELRSQLTSQDLSDAGIPHSCSDKYQLIMAIIDKKVLK